MYNNHLFVADAGHHAIFIFSLDGHLVHIIGTHGSGPTQFSNPFAVAISSDGVMFVTDWNNHRVQMLSNDGSLSCYGNIFNLYDQGVRYPLDIIFLDDNHLLVGDSSKNRVGVINTMGQLIHSFEVDSAPYGLAIDRNGDILVTLNRAKQVAVLQHDW